MSEASELTNQELRLKITWSKGYRPIHTTYGIKLMRPGPASVGFGMAQRTLEAPNWPEDVTAAFRLLNEFKNPEDEVTLQRREALWICEIRAGGEPFFARGETPQEAICKAYVLAKGISVET